MKSNKKVTFSNDSKKYDGSRELTQKYAKLVDGFFKNQINTVYDVIKLLKTTIYIDDFIIETEIIKSRLDNIKDEEEKEIINQIDPYWDSNFFIKKCAMHNNKKGFCISRFGSRDFNIKIYPENSIYLVELINLLENTKKCCVFL